MTPWTWIRAEISLYSLIHVKLITDAITVPLDFKCDLAIGIGLPVKQIVYLAKIKLIWNDPAFKFFSTCLFHLHHKRGWISLQIVINSDSCEDLVRNAKWGILSWYKWSCNTHMHCFSHHSYPSIATQCTVFFFTKLRFMSLEYFLSSPYVNEAHSLIWSRAIYLSYCEILLHLNGIEWRHQK